jgi:hypothetical protein
MVKNAKFGLDVIVLPPSAMLLDFATPYSIYDFDSQCSEVLF